MTSIELEAPSAESTRLLAGVRVPDTEPVAQAIAYAREYNEPFLFNHVMRSWLFAASLAEVQGVALDSEALAVAAVLHDLGLSYTFNGPLRFEVEGANAARDFALDMGIDDHRARLIWDSVALNSTPSLALHKEPEVALCTAGTLLDWSGQGASPHEIGACNGIGRPTPSYNRLAGSFLIPSHLFQTTRMDQVNFRSRYDSPQSRNCVQ